MEFKLPPKPNETILRDLSKGDLFLRSDSVYMVLDKYDNINGCIDHDVIDDNEVLCISFKEDRLSILNQDTPITKLKMKPLEIIYDF